MTKLDEVLRGQLGKTLPGTNLEKLGKRYEGKVRDNYSTPDGKRILVATDRISAFDVVLGTIPFKGQVLNQIAEYWFAETKKLAPNHVLAVPDPNVTIARECTPLKVIEQRGRVGEDDPLHGGVRDVALVPQRDVLDSRLGIGSQHPRQSCYLL